MPTVITDIVLRGPNAVCLNLMHIFVCLGQDGNVRQGP